MKRSGNEENPKYALLNAPREVARNYPGVWPSFSHIVPDIAGQNVIRITSADDQLGMRAGGLMVHTGESKFTNLDTFLASSGLATMDSRFPVLAIGSNASPAQIRHKFFGKSMSLIMPTLACEVTGLNIGFQAIATDYSKTAIESQNQSSDNMAFASAPFLSAAKKLQLFVQFLDEDQLKALDASEGSTYFRTWMPKTQQINLRLTETGELISGFFLYASEIPLLEVNGKLVELFEDGENGIEILEQEKLLEITDTAAKQGGLQHVIAPGFEQREQDDSKERRKYRNLFEEIGMQGNGKQFPILSSTVGSCDKLERHGESVIALGGNLVGVGDEVAVWSGRLDAVHKGGTAVALARVVAPHTVGCDACSEITKFSPKSTQVDELVRVATGLRIGEPLSLKKVKSPRPLAKVMGYFFLGRPPLVMMRVGKADLATTERNYALIPKLTMDMMGMTDGDPILIESVEMVSEAERFSYSDCDPVIRQIKLPGITLDDRVNEQRAALRRGSWNALHPSATEVLGVVEDLPQIMLDSANRKLLGLSKQPLGVVRVRVSRGRQYLKAFKEMPLVLFALAISAGIIFETNDGALHQDLMGRQSTWFFFLFLLAAVLLAYLPTRMRLRSKVGIKFSGKKG